MNDVDLTGLIHFFDELKKKGLNCHLIYYWHGANFFLNVMCGEFSVWVRPVISGEKCFLKYEDGSDIPWDVYTAEGAYLAANNIVNTFLRKAIEVIG
jgi:hypothetical protein